MFNSTTLNGQTPNRSRIPTTPNHFSNISMITPPRTQLVSKKYSLADMNYKSTSHGAGSRYSLLSTPPREGAKDARLTSHLDGRSPGLATRIVQYGEAPKWGRPRYDRPGVFPIVHLLKKDLPLLRRRPIHSSLPPAPELGRASPERARLLLEPAVRGEGEANPRSVLDALKEISRKRLHANEIEDDGKRIRVDTLKPSKKRQREPASPEAAGKRLDYVIDEITASKSSTSDDFPIEHNRKRPHVERAPARRLVDVETQTPPPVVPKPVVEAKTQTDRPSEAPAAVKRERTIAPLKIFDEKPLEVLRKNRLALLLGLPIEDLVDISSSLLPKRVESGANVKKVTFDLPNDKASELPAAELPAGDPPVLELRTEPVLKLPTIEPPKTIVENVPKPVDAKSTFIIPKLPVVSSTPNLTASTSSPTPSSGSLPSGGFTIAPIPSTSAITASGDVKPAVTVPTFSFGAPTPSAGATANVKLPPSLSLTSLAKPATSSSNFSFTPQTSTVSSSTTSVPSFKFDLSKPIDSTPKSGDFSLKTTDSGAKPTFTLMKSPDFGAKSIDFGVKQGEANSFVGQPVTSTTAQQFGFGNAAPPVVTKPSFGFNATTDSKPTFNFTSPSSSQVPTSTTSATFQPITEPVKAGGSFQFGKNENFGFVSATTNTTSTTNNAMNLVTSTTNPAVPQFNFTAAKVTTSAPVAPSTTLTFNNATSSTFAPKVASFGGFNSVPTTAPPAYGTTGSFGTTTTAVQFGTTTATTTSSPFNINNNNNSVANSGMFDTTKPKFQNGNAFNFGGTAAAPVVAPPNGGFFNSAPTTTASFGGFNAPKAITTTSGGIFGGFGNSTATAVPFGNATTAAPSFGAPTSNSVNFGAPTTNSGTFGVPTTNSGTFGVPTTTNATFGGPTTNSSTFGVPTTNSTFGVPTTNSGTFGAPTTNSGTFGVSTTNSTFGVSNTNNTFGVPTTNSGTFGVPTTNSGTFGAPTTTNATFGAFGSTVTTTASGVNFSKGFQSGATFGAASFGGAQAQTSTSGTFCVSSPTFGSSAAPFGSSFPATSAPTFGGGAAPSGGSFGTAPGGFGASPPTSSFQFNSPAAAAPPSFGEAKAEGVFTFGGGASAQGAAKQGVFSFGGAEAPKAGFNFGGAPQGPSVPAPGAFGGFGQGGAPPGGGMFSIGSGATTPQRSHPSRTHLRGRRRT